MLRACRATAVMGIALAASIAIAAPAHAAGWRFFGYYPTEVDCIQRGANQVNFNPNVDEWDCTAMGHHGWALNLNYIR